MKSDVISYLQSKGWRFVEWGGEIRLKQCPFCSSDGRAPFCINPETGACLCHSCGWSGGMTKLKTSQGDLVGHISEFRGGRSEKRVVAPPPELVERCHRALMDNRQRLDFFMRWRGLNEQTIKDFQIGWDIEHGYGYTYPYFERGKCIAIKYKNINAKGEKFVSRWCERDRYGKPVGDSGTRSCFFGVDKLRGNDRVTIVEGEDDALVLAMHGIPNVISLPNGSKGFSGAFLDAVEPFNDIVICMDNDRSGVEGAQKLLEKLGKARCRIATLPDGVLYPAGPWGDAGECKDISDFGRAGEICLVLNCIEDAPAFQHEKISHISDYIDSLRDEFINGPRSRGLSTGFPSLDSLIGGRRPGEITVISGNTGSGKSSLALNFCMNITQHGEGLLLGSFEQPVSAVLRKLTQMCTGRWFHLREDATGSSMTTADLDKACSIIAELPLYVVNVFGQMDITEYVDCISYAKRRLNCQTNILDHLHFMLRSHRADTERLELDAAMLALKQATIDHELISYVVVHPAKKRGEENQVVSIEDFRGSSFISQVADNVLVVWRDRNLKLIDPVLGRAQIHSLKCRSECGSEGIVEMGFSYVSQKFIDKLGIEDAEIEPSPFFEPEEAFQMDSNLE